MKAYELTADALAAEGVDVVFALLGDGNMVFLADLVARHGTRLVQARHENAAVAMADGWARTARRTGVCSVTCGPGLSQVGTALTAAVRNRTPLVLLAGDVPSDMAWNPQRFDQGLFTAATGARFVNVASLQVLARAIEEAFVVADRDRIPVVVSIPYDLQELEAPPPTPGARRAVATPPRPRMIPDDGSLADAAEKLIRASRPLVVAGRGAVEAGARAEILGLAKRIGATVGTTLLARDWFTGEPFDVGIVGGLSSRTTRELIAESDAVLAFGASLGYFATDNGGLLRGKEVIQVDIEPPRIWEGVRAATTHVRGDARLAAAALDALLAGQGFSAGGARTAETAERLAQPLPEYPEITPEPGTVDPAAAMAALNDALPPGPMLVFGVGHFWSFAVMHLHRPGPGDYLYAYGFGAVGHGLPTAIGAAVAAGRPVVLVEGDGSLLMHAGDLATVAAEQLDLLIVVLNDGGYGSEIHKLNWKGLDGELARFGRTDFAAVARGHGIAGHVLRDPADLAGLVAGHLAGEGPTLVDVPMARSAISAPTRRSHFPETIPPKED